MSQAQPTPQPQEKSGCCLFTILKIGCLLVVLAAATIAVLGLFVLNGSYELSREITIKASPQDVHKQVGDLREWDNWLPFTKQDPTIKVEIEKDKTTGEQKATGVGAHQTWVGNSGAGELTFTSSDPEKGIEFDMLFDKKYASKGALTYTKAGNETRVTWSMKGKNDDFVGRWLALAMPTMVGPMFDSGLSDLKQKVEKDKGS